MGSVEAAKAYLMKANAEGLSLYDHLAEVVSKLLAEKPEDALEQIEAISAGSNPLPGQQCWGMLVAAPDSIALPSCADSCAAAGGQGSQLRAPSGRTARRCTPARTRRSPPPPSPLAPPATPPDRCA